MQKDALHVKESSPSEKWLFLHAGHGREQNISMKMKRFLIKQLQRILNVSVTLIDRKQNGKNILVDDGGLSRIIKRCFALDASNLRHPRLSLI